METMFSNGMCRCCASEGTFKDLSTKYRWMGVDEVYSDMLQECFNVTLSTPEDSPEGGICEVCITQLRNAANFRKQVLNTEEQFKRMIQNKAFKSNIVKVEVNAPDDELPLTDEDNNLSNDDFSSTEYDLPIKTESSEEGKSRKRSAKAGPSRSKQPKLEGESSTKQGEPPQTSGSFLWKNHLKEPSVVQDRRSGGGRGKRRNNYYGDPWERSMFNMRIAETSCKKFAFDFLHSCPEYSEQTCPIRSYSHSPMVFSISAMLFKVVKTIQSGKWAMAIVPDEWERDGTLQWPRKHKFGHLSQDEMFNPDYEWMELPCGVVKGDIPTYVDALYELKNTSNLENDDSEFEEDFSIDNQNTTQIDSNANSAVFRMNLNPRLSSSDCNEKETTLEKDNLDIARKVLSTVASAPNNSNPTERPLFTETNDNNNPTQASNVQPVTELQNISPKKEPLSPQTVKEPRSKPTHGPVIHMVSKELENSDPTQGPSKPSVTEADNDKYHTQNIVPVTEREKSKPTHGPVIHMVSKDLDSNNATQGSSLPLTVANSNPTQGATIQLIPNESDSKAQQGPVIQMKSTELDNTNPIQVPLIQLISKEPNDSSPLKVPLMQLKSKESNNSNPIQVPFIEFISKEPNGSNVAQGSSIPLLMQSKNSNSDQATLTPLPAKERRDDNNSGAENAKPKCLDKDDPKLETKNPNIAKTDEKAAKDEFRKLQIENAKTQRKLHNLYAKMTAVLDNQTAMSSNQAALSTNFEEFMKKAGVSVKSLPVRPLDNQTAEFKIIENADELEKLEEGLKDPTYAKNLQKKLSTMCGRDDGNGMAVAYKLIDAMFTREFLPKCSWGGGSREDNMKKVCFRQYQRMMNLFCNVVRVSDQLFTMERLEVFVKRILRNAKQRCMKLNFKPWKPQPDQPNYVPQPKQPNIPQPNQPNIPQAEQVNIAQPKQPIKLLPKQPNKLLPKKPIKQLPKQPNIPPPKQPIIILPKQPNIPQPKQPNIPQSKQSNRPLLKGAEATSGVKDKAGSSRSITDDKIDEQGKSGTS